MGKIDEPPTLSSAGKRTGKWLRCIERWKSVCELLGIVAALYISYRANRVAIDALRETHASTQTQITDFRLRSRPYITLGGRPEFGGPEKSSDGVLHNHVLYIRLRNHSEVPATKVRTTTVLFIDGKGSNTNSIPWDDAQSIAILRDDERKYPVAFPDDIYAHLIQADQRICVTISVTYFGMLNERSPYKTEIQLNCVSTNSFVLSRLDFPAAARIP
ncbi:MAG TPA: hypothetical protein VL171_16580 [Verrucomicrobiae bacterium]|nr:hypothetical protein [Verrucomicrobiae bacterium]